MAVHTYHNQRCLSRLFFCSPLFSISVALSILFSHFLGVYTLVCVLFSSSNPIAIANGGGWWWCYTCADIFHKCSLAAVRWYVFCMTNTIKLISFNGCYSCFCSCYVNIYVYLDSCSGGVVWWMDGLGSGWRGELDTDVLLLSFFTLLSHYTNKQIYIQHTRPGERQYRQPKIEPIDMSCNR